jgi:hypothetical protein
LTVSTITSLFQPSMSTSPWTPSMSSATQGGAVIS